MQVDGSAENKGGEGGLPPGLMQERGELRPSGWEIARKQIVPRVGVGRIWGKSFIPKCIWRRSQHLLL